MSAAPPKKYVPPHLREGIKKAQAEYFPPRLSEIQTTIFEASATYRRLLLAEDKFYRDREVSQIFKERDEGELGSDRLHFLNRHEFPETMRHINDQSQGAILSVRGSFLDLCCAGGFSQWILKNNPDVRGVGVILDGAPGRRLHEEEWSEDMLRRYTILRMESLTRDLWENMGPFDLAIGAGRGAPKRSAGGKLKKEPRARFQVPVIVEALRGLKEGGTAMLSSFPGPEASTIAILFLLQRAFERLTPTSGIDAHQRRTRYYLVCEGYKKSVGEEVQETLIRCLGNGEGPWMDIVKEGSEAGRVLTDDRQDFLLKHFEPIWEAQMEAMHSLMENLKADGEDKLGASVAPE